MIVCVFGVLNSDPMEPSILRSTQPPQQVFFHRESYNAATLRVTHKKDHRPSDRGGVVTLSGKNTPRPSWVGGNGIDASSVTALITGVDKQGAA